VSTAPPEPGFVCVSVRPGRPAPDLATALGRVAPGARVVETAPGTLVASWGPADLAADGAQALSLELRRHDREVSLAEVAGYLRERDRAALREMLPTFGAVAMPDPGTVLAATDHLGFRQLYWRVEPGWAAVSTSARVLAGLEATGLDVDAVVVQALLGWQLGSRTLFAGVAQVPAGGLLTLRDGVADLDVSRPGSAEHLELPVAVERARDVLRGYLGAYLDDHPDPVLQLTGGQDSRLLLSAIPRRRRRGLRVLTLGVPGSEDVAIAADLASRFGMRHEVLQLRQQPPTPEEAYAACLEAAGRLELVCDPVARAALDEAEAAADPGPRLSGLGGEVARGFYYLGRSGMHGPVTEQRVRRLVDWRMFANESVPESVLGPDVRDTARARATAEVHSLLAGTGAPWFEATDRLYLEQRMQRWAGGTETAMCSRLEVANPMLDDRFIAIANALAPQDKQQSRFLARLQLALDEELAGLPLDGRPAPRAYAAPGWWGRAAQARATAGRARRKLVQRATGGRRGPAGGAMMSGAVVQHWRRHPELLAPAAASGLVDGAWVEDVLAGRAEPTSASVAFLLNLTAALDAVSAPAVPNLG
jgi:asparagine synthase (glutamine-hydrolysing)